MKFEDFLMPPSEKQRRRIALEEEVEELQGKLNREVQINSVLQNALRGPLLACPCLSSLLPLEVQELVAELAMVEKEIAWLETRIERLKKNMYKEKKINKDCQFEQLRKPPEMQIPCKQQKQGHLTDLEWFSVRQSHNRRKSLDKGRLSLSSVSDMRTCSSAASKEDSAKRYQRIIRYKSNHSIDAAASSDEPNRLSEELLKCLISIFVKLNQTSAENEHVTAANKHTLNCINSKGFSPKNTFSCKARSFIDEISQGSESTEIDYGTYKNFIQITRNSLKAAQLLDSCLETRKLRVLLQKLWYVDLAFLSNKQKLAFWINIYNASIMHAYLQCGLPNTQEGMLTILNKAALNVGGIVLNALAIEHYLLRHPSDPKHDLINEKATLLRRAYGLQFPEPNITFALCRGNWSSPALYIYTPEEVVNQLGRAKVEYLEACIRVTNKRKILVPKLLHWHMQDFADDMESLLEWIYSQLPPNGILKRAIMECLYEDKKVPTGKMIEIVPYQYEFQYLLPY
ncbi:Dual-specificity RNA methyltransferase RlmN [Bienertia sinuspersici]